MFACVDVHYRDDHAVAASCIAKMHGRFRLPTLLKIVDQISKNPSEWPLQNKE